MFISYKLIEMKGDKIKFTPCLVNLNFAKHICIESTSGKKLIKFFGSQLVIDMGKDVYYIHGYSDKQLNEIYKDIINNINNEFKGVYELPDIHEDSLYTIRIYTNNYGVNAFDLTGHIDSIEYLKERFSVLEGIKVGDEEYPHDYAIYYNPYKETYVRISRRMECKSPLENELKCFYKSIDDGDNYFRYAIR